MKHATRVGKLDARTPVSRAEFEAFVAERRERTVRIAYRMLGSDTAAAEDVAQEAFVRAYRGLTRFRGAASLDTWFYRILVREVQRQRRWRRLRDFWTPVGAAAPDPQDERAVGDPALRRRIEAALARLSSAQRDALVLVHLEGWTVVEAAAALHKAVGTVKSHLQRALESLRRELADLHESGPREPVPDGRRARSEEQSP